MAGHDDGDPDAGVAVTANDWSWSAGAAGAHATKTPSPAADTDSTNGTAGGAVFAADSALATDCTLAAEALPGTALSNPTASKPAPANTTKPAPRRPIDPSPVSSTARQQP